MVERFLVNTFIKSFCRKSAFNSKFDKHYLYWVLCCMITRFIYRPILLIASFAWKNKINRFLIYLEMIKYYSVELASFSWVFWNLIKPLCLPYRGRKECFKESQLLCEGGDVCWLVLVRERGGGSSCVKEVVLTFFQISEWEISSY